MFSSSKLYESGSKFPESFVPANSSNGRAVAPSSSAHTRLHVSLMPDTMDMYTDGSTLSMDAPRHSGYFPSSFGTGEYLQHDEGNMDFLFSPHGLWNMEPVFQQEPYFNDMTYCHPVAAYDVAVACQPPVVPPYPLESQRLDDQKTVSQVGLKRKRQSSSKCPRQKQQKQPGSQSSSPKSSHGSIASDSSETTAPSSRAHYAVEKRYRSTLNDRYATLARIVSQAETQEICRTENKDWEVPAKLDGSGSDGDKQPGKRQSKTTTLSVAIDTVALLDRCCMRKAKELQSLICRLDGIVKSMPNAAVSEDV